MTMDIENALDYWRSVNESKHLWAAFEATPHHTIVHVGNVYNNGFREMEFKMRHFYENGTYKDFYVRS